MNDFFAHQERAHRNTFLLVVLFVLAVAGIIVSIYVVAWATLLLSRPRTAEWLGLRSDQVWNLPLFAACACTCVLAVVGASSWRLWQLRSRGSDALARAMGARAVPPHTADPQERQLRNVVEEMAIAAGIPVPKLYLLESEGGINAFTAGFTPEDATLCVTRGAIVLLDRDELQGVVAHEFSHILNGDTALNLNLIGWLHGISSLSAAGTSGGLVGIALMTIGFLGYAFAERIKAAVSRQREYLADAAAAQFTRNPAGLAGALKKIAALDDGSQIHHRKALEASHLFFSDALSDGAGESRCHPPLRERIRHLEPTFAGILPKVTPLPDLGENDFQIPVRSRNPAPVPYPTIRAALERDDTPLHEHLAHARQMLASLPEPVTAASREPRAACALVYGLLLDSDPAVRARQEALVEARDGADALARMRDLLPALATVAPEVRLPLLHLALPALRTLSPEQFQRLQQTTRALTDADRHESLFEFLLRAVLLRHLEPRFSARVAPVPLVYGISGVSQACAQILSAMARVGHRSEAEAQAAFDAGVRLLDPGVSYPFLAASACGPNVLTPALESLEEASIQVKRRVLAACLECLNHDRAATPDEAMLFQAFADAMGCPLPAKLQSAGVAAGRPTPL